MRLFLCAALSAVWLVAGVRGGEPAGADALDPISLRATQTKESIHECV